MRNTIDQSRGQCVAGVAEVLGEQSGKAFTIDAQNWHRHRPIGSPKHCYDPGERKGGEITGTYCMCQQ